MTMKLAHTLALTVVLAWPNAARAAEGSTAAAPIGGTDMRAAQLPPPGLYGGAIALHIEAHKFYDGQGKAVPALNGLHLTRERGGVFLGYVPNLQIFGGSIALRGMLPFGRECGKVFEATPSRCIDGLGDPYVEVDWSRYFGTPRLSHYAGALPIAEGLTVLLGFGAAVPLGRFNAEDATRQGLVIGNNVWDFAPIVGFTYMTRPILAEGTEISAKLYWNNYLENPATHYETGPLLNTTFAITERIGRLQVGLAGFYAVQPSGDKQFGVSIPPDGRRADTLQLGGVAAYDLPEIQTTVKLKGLATVITDNTVGTYGISLSFIRKLD